MSKQDETATELGSGALGRIIQAMNRNAATVDGPHFVDDDELLDRWSLTQLSKEEHQQIIAHLARCSECADTVRKMIENDALDFPAPDDTPHEVDDAGKTVSEDPRVELPRNKTVTRSRTRSVLVTAACLLIAVTGYLVFRQTQFTEPDVLLAQANYGTLTHYLTEAEFGAVVTGQHTKGPGTIVLVPRDSDREERIQEAHAAKQETPDSLSVRLNYGQVLLEDGQLDEALAEFEFVLSRDPANASAQLAQGMVWFRQKKTAQAAAQFESLAGDDTYGDSATVNQVLCLIALNQKDQAAQLWQAVPEAMRTEQISRVLSAGR